MPDDFEVSLLSRLNGAEGRYAELASLLSVAATLSKHQFLTASREIKTARRTLEAARNALAAYRAISVKV